MMLTQHAMHQQVRDFGCHPSMPCASQSQAWEAMLFQNVMQLTLLIKEHVEAQNNRRGEGRDFSDSLASAISKQVNISAQSSRRRKEGRDFSGSLA